MKRILLGTVAAAALLGFSGSAMATGLLPDGGFVSDWDWYKKVYEFDFINFNITGNFDPTGETQVWVDQTFFGSVSATGYIFGDFDSVDCSLCGPSKTLIGQIEQTVSAVGVALQVESQVPIFAAVDQHLFGDVSAMGVVGFPAEAVVDQTVSAVGIVTALEVAAANDPSCIDCYYDKDAMYSDLIINADISQFACGDVSAYGKIYADLSSGVLPEIEGGAIVKQAVTAAGLVTSIVNKVAVVP